MVLLPEKCVDFLQMNVYFIDTDKNQTVILQNANLHQSVDTKGRQNDEQGNDHQHVVKIVFT